MRDALALAAPAALLAGCAALGAVLAPLPRLADCPGPLRPTAEIAGDFVRHERVRVRGGDVDESFGLVVQKTGSRLVVVGLNAFGAKAFAITQDGVATESRSYLGRALGVPPENVLRDLHRAYFLEDAPGGAGERALARAADGALHVSSARCGYEAIFAPQAPSEPSAPAGAPP